ncbi:ABC transporter ATP-binding protein [bacterium]|nr:ABC transporter ATP-binding protein [bacterium]
MKYSVEARDVKKKYGKGHAHVDALTKVTFNIKNGEFVSFVGPSGSGKSTLLNMIGGMDTPTSGSLIVGGKDLTKASRAELVQHRRYTVGMIFQSFNLIPDLSAVGNVEFAMIFGGVPRKKRGPLASEILEKVGLKERILHTPGELSGGEAQRVAIARAMSNNPEILLADEPTGNLDSKTSLKIINILKDLNESKKITVIMVTHDIPLAETVSHRIIHLLDGEIEKEQGLRNL